MIPVLQDRPEVSVNVIEVLKIALGVYLVGLTLFTAWLRPTASSLVLGVFIGIAAGMGYSWLFYAGRYRKRLLSEGVSLISL